MTTTSRPRSRRPLLALLLAATVATGLAGCGGSEEPGQRITPSSPFSPYVALGDSYTAVSGLDSEPGDGCYRSESAYPILLAEKLGIGDVTNVACGGATSDNLTQTQYPGGKGRMDPQLDALGPETKLVTLGIGLNDNAYNLKTLTPCFLVGGREQTACAEYRTRPDSYFDGLVQGVADNVARDLAAIKDAAPNARVVLVGYPRLLPDGRGCNAQVPLVKAAIDRVRASTLDISKAFARVAERAGADYLDTYAASKGHDACSKDPWVSGYRPAAGTAFQFHPFPAYHVAVADLLAELLNG